MKPQIEPAPQYRSFWLRCWTVDGRAAGEDAQWHFSLENPETGQKKGFGDLNMLVDYLKANLVTALDERPEPDFQNKSGSQF